MKTKHTILLFLNLTVFVIILLFSLISIGMERCRLLGVIDSTLLSVAQSARFLLPDSYHDKIVDGTSVSDEEYLAIVNRNNELCRSIDIQYLWSLMEIDGRIVFTTATSTSKDVRNGDHASFFEVHSNPGAYEAAFATMEIQRGTFTDQWGEGRMVLIPFRDSRGRKCLFGASKSLRAVNAELLSSAKSLVLASLPIMLLGFIVSLLVTRAVTRPITHFVQTVHKVARGKTDHDIIVKGNPEIMSLAGSINTMIRSVRHSATELRQIIDMLPDMVYIKDGDGRIHLANKAHASIHGMSVEEITGRKLTEVSHNSDTGEKARDDDKSVIENREAVFIPEEVYIDPAGEKHFYQTQKMPFTLPETGAPAILGVSIDITERKRLENQLLQSQKMESVGRLAGGIAHDFNNILTAITGYAEYAMQTVSSEHPVYADIEEIMKSADRAADLTRQLLAFSRRQVIEPKVLDLNTSLAGLDKMLRRLIGEHIDYNTVFAEGLWSVKLDVGQIEQLLTNLVVNAGDAMPDGGSLTIETANAVLDDQFVHAHPGIVPGSYVMLAVTDTGMGMSESIKDRIFEPFFTTKDEGKGTGLGLSTCYGIVKQNNGYIWIDSEEGQGTSVRIFLPSIDEKPVVKDTVENRNSRPGGHETILVVEDEEDVRLLLDRLFRDAGYAVITAADGQEALRIMEGYAGKQIDLLISDMVMPKMNGRDLAEILGRTHKNMKVLFISGYADNSLIQRSLLMPGVAFLQKPFNPSGIMNKVRQVLDSQGSV